MAKARKWELQDGDYYIDGKSRTVVFEMIDLDGIRAQIPICEVLGLESLEYKHEEDKKKAEKRFTQNARTLNKALEMVNLLKRIDKVLAQDNPDKKDVDGIRKEISEIAKYINSSKPLGELQFEKHMNRKVDRYGRIQ